MKNRAKFPATTCGDPMAKIACLDDAFLEDFELEANTVGQSLQQKDKKWRKRKGPKKERKKLNSPKTEVTFLSK